MTTVVNTQARHIVLPTPKKFKRATATTAGVRLLPGANVVKQEILDALMEQDGSAGDDVRGYFKRGWLRLQEAEDKHPVNEMNVPEAQGFIKVCTDKNELVQISLMDTRKMVRDAVDQRLMQLG